jgi:putative adenylate-forming enzyme
MLAPAFSDVPLIRLAGAFLRTRRLAGTLKTRVDVERWQHKRIARWLQETVAQAGYYRGRKITALGDLPVIDKPVLMASFEQFNSAGLTRDHGWAILQGAPPPNGYVVGASTGTSGNRGLFVISNAERYEWLGVMLGKLLPRFPFEAARIALVLPLHTQLYASANRTRRLRLEFFDLGQGVQAIAAAVADYRPDTIIAPPKVLRWLAEHDATLKPRRLFSAAEVLDPIDRAIIEERYRQRLGQIYMATEGLLGTSCAHGTLHLAEDVMHFELEPVAGSGLVSPIISDFTRQTQVMARYQMNDLLRLKADGCACGSPLQAIAEVVGRSDDSFELPLADGEGTVMLTPDVLRNAVVDADRRITDFRVVQTGPDAISLLLAESMRDETLALAQAGLTRLLQGAGTSARVIAARQALSPSTAKLRRVERRWFPDKPG